MIPAMEPKLDRLSQLLVVLAILGSLAAGVFFYGLPLLYDLLRVLG